MVVVEGQGIPIGVLLASAQQAEITLAPATLATIRVPSSKGRPRTRPRQLVADRGYDSRAFRRHLRRRGIRPCIPPRKQQGRRRPGRPLQHFLKEYAQRWIVERTFAWLGNFRRLVVRYERLIKVYHGLFLLACILICLARILE
jgi:IS5 family transposase